MVGQDGEGEGGFCGVEAGSERGWVGVGREGRANGSGNKCDRQRPSPRKKESKKRMGEDDSLAIPTRHGEQLAIVSHVNRGATRVLSRCLFEVSQRS